MAGMRTYRMVVETKHGLCTVDVVLRGRSASAVVAVAPEVKKWLDFGIGFAGTWVDDGTDRAGEYTIAGDD